MHFKSITDHVNLFLRDTTISAAPGPSSFSVDLDPQFWEGNPAPLQLNGSMTLFKITFTWFFLSFFKMHNEKVKGLPAFIKTDNIFPWWFFFRTNSFVFRPDLNVRYNSFIIRIFFLFNLRENV